MINGTFDDFLDKKESYYSDNPFPHWVIDNMFDDSIIGEVANSDYLWDVQKKAKAEGWGVSRFENHLEGKCGVNNVAVDEKVHSILKFMNSDEFISFLSKLTGIPDLEGDSDFIGGGLHLTPRNGRLGIHLDFSKHPNSANKSTFWRRVNCLLYLNKDWPEEWKGHLELWDKPEKHGGVCIKQVKPDYNRLAIFGTSKQSWHGHKTPLECPKGKFRCSLATYFYSETPSVDLVDHSTVFADLT